LATEVVALAEFADTADQGSWRIGCGYLVCMATCGALLQKSNRFCGGFFDIEASTCRLRRGIPDAVQGRSLTAVP